jgi:Asp-tRNA(Asn)/Glu-tRNA(Gln) amidotransferase C subunit
MSKLTEQKVKKLAEQLENNPEFVDMVLEAAQPENMSEPMTMEEFRKWLKVPPKH